MISSRGGKISARVLLLTAPIREISKSRWGITAASATEMKIQENVHEFGFIFFIDCR